MPAPVRIGIDLDNTIVGYDRLFCDIATAKGWLPARFDGSKKQVRDLVRLLPDGEGKWMRLQAEAYGARMGDADLIDGVDGFLRHCRAAAIPVSIISHKTRFAAADPDGVDLRQAALAWLESRGFFSAHGYGVPRERVFFEDTRGAKCRRISSEQCTHFIDDLEEVFHDPDYPRHVASYLFIAPGSGEAAGPYRVHHDWTSIADDILASTAA
jgi:hypothetical protein